jgi:hypothetical protein
LSLGLTAKAGTAVATITAAISAATASTIIMRLKALPATVCFCPIVFLLLVEGAGLGPTLASARLPVTRKTLDSGVPGGIRRITQKRKLEENK